MNIAKIRSDFPILDTLIQDKPLVYLDNSATTHKPRKVLDRVMAFYTRQNSNIHRGVHHLSDEASTAYEAARETVRSFINGERDTEIVFTSGATESINMVADTFGRIHVGEGDDILITEMEHHSNIVPWQVLCERQGAVLKILPFDHKGELILDRLKAMMSEKTRLLALTQVSNVLGTVNPVKEIIQTAHARGVPVLVDGAQAVQHMPVDVRDLDCDFYVFSGHKMYAETGIGVLYGKEKWLEAMPPNRFGGGMIEKVGFDRTTFASLPFKFEAGTGNIAAALSLAAAIDYMNEVGWDDLSDHEGTLMKTARRELGSLEGMTVYGDPARQCAAVSFNLDGVHPYDVGLILDKLGIAVRTGTHCAEPIMKHYGIQGTIRASFALYNTVSEVDQLVKGLMKARAMTG